MCGSLEEQFSTPYTVFKSTFKGRLDEINLPDYQYAMADYHEFFAEIFTAYYIRGDRKGQIVEYVENAEKYIRKYIMKQ